MSLKEELLLIVENSSNIRNERLKTSVQIVYDEVVDKMKIAATNGHYSLNYSFKFLPENRDGIMKEVVSLLLQNDVSVKQLFPDDNYLFTLGWCNEVS